MDASVPEVRAEPVQGSVAAKTGAGSLVKMVLSLVVLDAADLLADAGVKGGRYGGVEASGMEGLDQFLGKVCDSSAPLACF